MNSPEDFDGWRFAEGRLYSPEGWQFTPGDIRAGRINEQLIKALQQEVATRSAAPSRFRMLEMLNQAEELMAEVQRYKNALRQVIDETEPMHGARIASRDPRHSAAHGDALTERLRVVKA